MSNTFYVIPKNSDLQHYGVLGMKWGVRRYQNADGSYTDAGRRRYFNSNGQLTSSGKAKQAIDQVGQKGRQASRLMGLGTLIAGPVGAIAGLISGYAMSPEQTDKVAKAGLGVLAAEVAAITGFTSISNLANAKKKQIDAGSKFVDLGDYFDTGKKNTGRDITLKELGIDEFDVDKFYSDEAKEAVKQVRNVVMPDTTMTHPVWENGFHYKGVQTNNPAWEMSEARNKGYISRYYNTRSEYGRKNLAQDDLRIKGTGGFLDRREANNIRKFISSKNDRKLDALDRQITDRINELSRRLDRDKGITNGSNSTYDQVTKAIYDAGPNGIDVEELRRRFK